MNAEIIEHLDPDLLKDADSTAELPVARPPAPVPTMRLAALLPSAPPGPLPTAPMPVLAPLSPPNLDAARPTVFTRRPSWIRELIKSALTPSASPRVPLDERITRRTAGAACVGVAAAFAFSALVTGLRGAPDPSLPAAVGAMLVLSRALVALGAGAFAFGLLRMAERLLAPSAARPSLPDDGPDSAP